MWLCPCSRDNRTSATPVLLPPTPTAPLPTPTTPLPAEGKHMSRPFPFGKTYQANVINGDGIPKHRRFQLITEFKNPDTLIFCYSSKRPIKEFRTKGQRVYIEEKVAVPAGAPEEETKILEAFVDAEFTFDGKKLVISGKNGVYIEMFERAQQNLWTNVLCAIQ
mmetsp:Transcript_20824/g.37091  ORF Transcript_20824/g.37091 Transcript_20824/m.37091 type:complete len:164 (-) Transcript_20824:254-745(-)